MKEPPVAISRAALSMSMTDFLDRAMLRSGKQHRIEGQHLRADRNHKGNALNRVSHIIRPAIIVLYRHQGRAGLCARHAIVTIAQDGSAVAANETVDERGRAWCRARGGQLA